MNISGRLVASVCLTWAAVFATPTQAGSQLPVLFVHGNGDSAALWHTTLWRFESNGYDPKKLFAIDFVHPAARGDDTKAQENRSGTVDQAAQLSAAVTRALLKTGANKIILVGNSRGGNAIRNYIKNAGGDKNVATAILSGTPNHGVFSAPANLNSEWNGMGTFLSGLNAVSEVHPNVQFVTIRSVKNDKYAQPTGEFIGLPGKPTGVNFDGPALRGAYNIALKGLDHRETAFHKKAFAEIYRVIEGRSPASLEIVPEVHPALDGMISGYANGEPTNLPLSGAQLSVFEVDKETGERKGTAAHTVTTGADGRWGPFSAKPDAYYEFVTSAEGYPTTHIYRSPFPRSSNIVHIRLEPVAEKFKNEGSIVTMTRPRGYLGHGRDTFTLDGETPEGVNKGVPGTSAATKAFPSGPQRVVKATFNGESITTRTFPLAEGHVVLAEFHY